MTADQQPNLRERGPSRLRAKDRSADRAGYYAEGASWAADVNGSLRASRRVAWTVAAIAAGVAALEALALVLLTPLKTVVPYTILVDRQTGYVQTVAGLQVPGRLTQDEAVIQSALVQYVLARESFDRTDLAANYRKVALWTGGDARAAYIAAMQRSNPLSPLRQYPPNATVQVTVKSVSIIGEGEALVRFETQRQDGPALGDRRAYAAVIGYAFTGSPMTMQDRFFDPLGFKVTRYRRDSETVGALPPVPAAPAPVL